MDSDIYADTFEDAVANHQDIVFNVVGRKDNTRALQRIQRKLEPVSRYQTSALPWSYYNSWEPVTEEPITVRTQILRPAPRRATKSVKPKIQLNSNYKPIRDKLAGICRRQSNMGKYRDKLDVHRQNLSDTMANYSRMRTRGESMPPLSLAAFIDNPMFNNPAYAFRV